MDECLLKTMAEKAGAQKKTLQIAIFTDGQSYRGIRNGLRLLPLDKLVIIHEEVPGLSVQELDVPFGSFAKQVSDALMTQVDEVTIHSGDLNEVLGAMKSIYKQHSEEFRDILLNVSEGGKLLSCTAISSAFIFGIRAFWIDQDGVHMLPILKLGYQKILSDTKIAILGALSRKGGKADSLEVLAEMTGLEKSLISRHLNGSEDSQGLVELGLVSVRRQTRGRIEVEVTALGKIVTI